MTNRMRARDFVLLTSRITLFRQHLSDRNESQCGNACRSSWVGLGGGGAAIGADRRRNGGDSPGVSGVARAGWAFNQPRWFSRACAAQAPEKDERGGTQTDQRRAEGQVGETEGRRGRNKEKIVFKEER
jgi:hypothetical protein